jgi:DNA repair exonuclease SbcCD ATPase subunit
VSLKKPGDFFKTEDKNKVEIYSQSTSLPESYDAYKSNLKNIEVLADFTESVGTLKENAERITTLSTEIQNLQEQLSQFIKQEDLDRSTVSHLLFVEENIENIQQKIKGLNSKTLLNIKEEFRGLQETVSEFIRLEVPSYKKQILETERRTDIRFIDFKNQIQEEVTSIDSHLTEKLSLISDTISGINEDYLNEFRNEVSVLENSVDNVLENELPRYKRFFTETELRTEEKIKDVTDFVESKVDTLENNYQNQIQNLNSLVKDFTEQEIPKYRGLITESKLQVEKDFVTLEESIQNKIEEIDKSVSLAIEKSKEQNESNDQQLIELQQIIEDSKNQIDTISRTYENLHKDFRNREAHENQKLESYEGLLNDFSEKINALENNLNDNVSLLHNDLNISTSKYYDILKKEVGSFEENISNKVKDLEVNIVVNEKHIHRIKDSVYEILDGLKLDLIEEKSQELTEKISHVERILEQFNEKTLLNEGLLNEPPNVKTSDPLTPLDQNYVTLPQLQEHYRLFINRIQQQLSTLGGGGAVRLDDLDDVDHSNITTNNLLIYNGTRWVGIASTALSGTLIGLSDVDSSNLGDGRFLRYDASTSDFTFAPVSATNLELIAGDIQSGILTTNSTSQAVVMSISATTYRSVQYQVQVTQGTNYNMTTINVIHDGTTTYMSEFGSINQPIGIATFSSDISGGSLRLLGHPAFASPTTFKTVFTAIEA